MVPLLIALTLAAPLHTASGDCRATAQAAVKTTKVTVPSLGETPIRVTAKDVDTAICFDFTGDGRSDIAFSVFSGGTAGDIAWGVLVRKQNAWSVAITGAGYKLAVRRSGLDAVVTEPVYKAGDPNCCPTAGFDHVAYRWNGKSFAAARRWHTKTFTP